jgi:hypothetical protein
MPEIITIRECLEIMRAGNTFSLTCITYDRNRRTGGELLEIAEAQWLDPEKEEAEAEDRQQRPLTLAEMYRIDQAAGTPPAGRAPNHRQWHTRNIRILCDGHPTAEIRKVHPPLFLSFNGRPVMP